MFSEIATEAMGDGLIRRLEKKAEECANDPEVLGLIAEFAGWVLEEVEFPGKDLVERVGKLRRLAHGEPKNRRHLPGNL